MIAPPPLLRCPLQPFFFYRVVVWVPKKVAVRIAVLELVAS